MTCYPIDLVVASFRLWLPEGNQVINSNRLQNMFESILEPPSDFACFYFPPVIVPSSKLASLAIDYLGHSVK
jgi:hypothetical protein